MAVTRRGTSRAAIALGVSIQVGRPAGTQDGDLLLACVAAETLSGIRGPAGWTQATSTTIGTYRVETWWRLDDGGAGPHVFDYGGASLLRWWRCVSYTGHHPAAPIVAAGAQSGSGLSITAPSVTPTVDDCMLAFFGAPDGLISLLWTPPSRMSAADDIADSVFYAEQSLTGGAGTPTGSKTGTILSVLANVGVLVAIAPRVPGRRALTATGIG